jgi:hypothetical protein
MVRESFLPPEDNRKTIAGLPPAAENEAVKARAFELLKKIRSVALATVNNDKPAVRIVSVSAIRDDRIYFLAPVENLSIIRSGQPPMLPYAE